MPDMDESQRHWSELAEQLGLPPEQALPLPEFQSALPPLPKPEPARPGTLGELFDAEAAQFHEPAENRIEPPSGEDSAVVSDVSSLPEGDRRSPRGRRRGRRGGRRSEESAANPHKSETADEVAPEAEGPANVEEEVETMQPERSRRRGRSRRKKEPADYPKNLVAIDEATAPDQTVPEAAEEREDDDNDDMSGWTIPSWQELIDSLYRPDR